MKTTSQHKTLGLRTIIIALLIVATVVGELVLFQNNADPVQAYPYGCVTQECREAYDRAEASDRAAREAAANAQTLEGEVARLNSEIQALEDEITKNQAIANDLSAQITLNEEKLATQRAALAELLVDMHFEDESDVIAMLASSSSLGDLAEKQSRQATVKSQIAISSESIRITKEELESQKQSVDALIASTELTRNEITARRNEQEVLITKYQYDNAAYTQDAAAAREVMQQEIAAEIARYNSGGVVGEGYNSYPWASQCPWSNLAFITVGGYVCQCTSYAGYKTQEFWGIYISNWGNAYSWANSARRNGYVVDNNPAPHTVAVSTAGEWGHVMWVESVNANGTINLTEYNNMASSKNGWIADFGARYNVNPNIYQYIHFDKRLW